MKTKTWEWTVMSEYRIKKAISDHLKKNPSHGGYPLRGVVAKAQAERTWNMKQVFNKDPERRSK